MAVKTVIRNRRLMCESCASWLRSSRGSKGEFNPLRPAWYSSSTARDKPFRVGIIGSGPAGFYAATRIIEKMPTAIVDMYEQLPVPFGLVRFGVAPDHPEVKNCEQRFEQIAESPRFNFIGNVAIGKDIPLGALKPHYDALLFAYGASEDRTLGIPGEDLAGIYSARAFVGWYNGLPEHASLKPIIDQGEVATVIGHGNVALDVARILLSNVNELKGTDITDEAVDLLSKSKIRKVVTVGRRGPIQASFTIKEVRELINLQDTNFILKDPSLLPTQEYIRSLPKLLQRRFRLTNLLVENSKASSRTKQQQKAWELWSMRSPLVFEPSSTNASTSIERIKFAINEFVDPNNSFDPTARVQSTNDTEYLQSDIVFRSIGYKSVPLPTMSDLGIVFDTKAGIIPNDPYGRILASRQNQVDSREHIPGCYCAGWVKRGPTGVIASTMDDAFSTADVMMQDWESGVPFLNGSANSVTPERGGLEAMQADTTFKRSIQKSVTWKDWQKIDAVEVERGRKTGKKRKKFQNAQDMLDVLS